MANDFIVSVFEIRIHQIFMFALMRSDKVDTFPICLSDKFLTPEINLQKYILNI
jgi:hypothetical protein